MDFNSFLEYIRGETVRCMVAGELLGRSKK
jgi:hypothetical protein